MATKANTRSNTANATAGDRGRQADEDWVVGSTATVHDRLKAEKRVATTKRAAALRQAAGLRPVDDAVLQADRAAAVQRGGYVQKSLEHLRSAERKLEAFLSQFPLSRGEQYPSADKMIEFVAWCTRTRERQCLAQREVGGVAREGMAKRTVRNYISEMRNHLWEEKYKGFALLSRGECCAYWQQVVEGFDGIYAAASSNGGPGDADSERVQQLVCQTAATSTREHFYRTEIHQVQDVFVAERERVNWALLSDQVVSIIQSSAARIGMICKDASDKDCLRWADENVLRVRDIKFAVLPLMVRTVDGDKEATSHVQLNWRRVKRAYFEVYLFRSAVTANAQSAVRRSSVRIVAGMIQAGRFSACRAGLSDSKWRGVLQLCKYGRGFRGLQLCDTNYTTWLELVCAVIDSGYAYNADMLDHPAVPHVDKHDQIHLAQSMRSCEVRDHLGAATLRLGYEPNKAGLWSLRRYSIATVVRHFGIHKGTRQAQHNNVNSDTVNSTYDADNASFEVGAGEMGREEEYIEPVDSLARRRVPAIASIRGLKDCRGSAAYKDYFEHDAGRVLASQELQRAQGAVQQSSSRAKRQAVATAKAEYMRHYQRCRRTTIVRHRQAVHAAGVDALGSAPVAERVALQSSVEYPQMSEAEAIAFLLSNGSECAAGVATDSMAGALAAANSMQSASNISRPVTTNTTLASPLLPVGDQVAAPTTAPRPTTRRVYSDEELAERLAIVEAHRTGYHDSKWKRLRADTGISERQLKRRVSRRLESI